MKVLITGASGGLGEVLARTLSGKGATVFGTMRDPSKRGAGEFEMLAMEATSDASVTECIDALVAREGKIDAVVNCVNRMMIGSTDEQTVEEVKHLYDTNVFGVMRVCKAIAPHMRSAGEGTIVNMSSLGGVLAVPYMSAYTSAKFALEAFSEALYHELRGTGVDVVIMQPVAMKMDRPATGAHLDLVDGVSSDSRSHAMVERMAADTEASGLTPEMVSEKIYEVLQMKKKPLRVPMDRAKVLGRIKPFLPQGAINRLLDGLLDA